MFFLGRNFVSGVICTLESKHLKPKKPLKPQKPKQPKKPKNLKKVF